MKEPGPCYSPWVGRDRVVGLSKESKLAQSSSGNCSSPEHTRCKALHPSPARLGLCLPASCTQTQHCSTPMAPAVQELGQGAAVQTLEQEKILENANL